MPRATRISPRTRGRVANGRFFRFCFPRLRQLELELELAVTLALDLGLELVRPIEPHCTGIASKPVSFKSHLTLVEFLTCAPVQHLALHVIERSQPHWHLTSNHNPSTSRRPTVVRTDITWLATLPYLPTDSHNAIRRGILF